MEKSKNQRDGLITVVIKVSICLLFCLLARREVKAQMFTHLGHPLANKSLRDKAKQIYNSQVGVREKGVNAGPEVEQYLRYVSLAKGNPWCAAFVCWVFGRAGVGNPRSGWSPDLFPASRTILPRVESGTAQLTKSGKLKTESGWTDNWRQTSNAQIPRAGDVFGLYFPEKGRIAHVGFVDEWKDPWMVTVEGNTNVLGSREGDGVYRKRRLIRSVYKVARYAE